MVKITGKCKPDEARAYVDYLEKKYNRKLKALDIKIDGDEVELRYEFLQMPFERIRRITGYLVGDMSTWNDSKKAEERDRVKHDAGEIEQL